VQTPLTKGVVNSRTRRPNSFVYRFIPVNVSDLKQGGKLQALQVKRYGRLFLPW